VRSIGGNRDRGRMESGTLLRSSGGGRDAGDGLWKEGGVKRKVSVWCNVMGVTDRVGVGFGVMGLVWATCGDGD
jgi:hypothetical protein